MKLDAARSRIVIHTFAEGLLSALAHDLEIAAREPTGEASERDAEVRVPVSSLEIVGVVKRGRVDPAVLSASDRASILKQVREEVLRGDVVARGALDASGKRARIDLSAPVGRASFECDVAIERGEAQVRARGEAAVSLRALGAPPVKGPMGAFRVADRVTVAFDLLFT